MSKSKALARHILLLGIAVSVAGCDYASKHAATEMLAGEPARSYFFDTVRLIYAENPGSFLSLGAALPEPIRFILFTLGPGVLLVLLVVYGARMRWSGTSVCGIVLYIAGGASNWVDRLGDGRVVDFLNIGLGPVRSGIFNVADMAISAGIAILLAGEYARFRKRSSGETHSA